MSLGYVVVASEEQQKRGQHAEKPVRSVLERVNGQKTHHEYRDDAPRVIRGPLVELSFRPGGQCLHQPGHVD